MGLIDAIKRWWAKLIPVKDIETALNIKPLLTAGLQQRRTLWASVLAGEAWWNNKDVPSVKIADTIVNEVAQAVTTKAESIPADKYIDVQYQRIFGKRLDVAIHLICSDVVVIKPFIYQDQIHYNIISNANYVPLARDTLGKLTSAVFPQTITKGETYYTLLETQTFENGKLRIEHKAYTSSFANALGRPIPLTSVPEWATLPEFVEWSDVTGIWAQEFHNVNGEALFAPAINWLEQADAQMARIIEEFKNGRMVVFATEDLFDRRPDGTRVITDSVFRVMKSAGGMDSSDNLFKTHSPTLREEAYNQGLNIFKRAIEDICGLTRSTISDPQFSMKTATEVQAAKPRYANTVANLQDALKTGFQGLIDVTVEMAFMYRLIPSRKPFETTFVWDDTTIVTEAEKRQRKMDELNTMLQLQQVGVVNAAEIRAFYTENSEYFHKLTKKMVADAEKGLSSTFEEV